MQEPRHYISFYSYLFVFLFLFFSNLNVIDYLIDVAENSTIEVMADDFDQEKESSDKEGKAKDDVCMKLFETTILQEKYNSVHSFEFNFWNSLNTVPSYPPPEFLS